MNPLNAMIRKYFSEGEVKDVRRETDKVSMDVLLIELTRRCNMKCAHCLRGDAQNIDIDKNKILRMINMASNISEVVFTGGEPSLRVDLIEWTRKLLLKKFGAGNLPAFFVATNGKENQEKLAITLLKWYADAAEPEICEISISHDIFHEKVEAQVFNGLAFYTESKTHSLDETEESASWIIAEGRGEYLGRNPGLYRRTVTPEDFYSVRFEEWGGKEVYVVEGDVYLSATGAIMADCDYSYDTIDENALCQVEDLVTYLERRIDDSVL